MIIQYKQKVGNNMVVDYKYDVYNITDKEVSWVMKWFEHKIDGATKFESVGDDIGENLNSFKPSLQGLSLGETRQFILDTIKNDFKHGRKEKCLNNLDMEDIIKNANSTTTSPIKIDDFNDDNKALKIIEEYIYSLDYKNIGYIWMFADKVFYID